MGVHRPSPGPPVWEAIALAAGSAPRAGITSASAPRRVSSSSSSRIPERLEVGEGPALGHVARIIISNPTQTWRSGSQLPRRGPLIAFGACARCARGTSTGACQTRTSGRNSPAIAGMAKVGRVVRSAAQAQRPAGDAAENGCGARPPFRMMQRDAQQRCRACAYTCDGGEAGVGQSCPLFGRLWGCVLKSCRASFQRRARGGFQRRARGWRSIARARARRRLRCRFQSPAERFF